MKINSKKITTYSIIGSFIGLYLIVSIISMIHSVKFFQITNSDIIYAYLIAFAFELGCGASLAAIIILDKLETYSKWLLGFLFILLMLIQIIGNTFYAYSNIDSDPYLVKLFTVWKDIMKVFDVTDVPTNKFIVSILGSSLLPLISNGFIKLLVDYMPHTRKNIEINESITSNQTEINNNPIESTESNEIVNDNTIQSDNISTEINNDELIENVVDEMEIDELVEPLIEPTIETTDEIITVEPIQIDTYQPVKRGRPKGSKNKKENIYGENVDMNVPIELKKWADGHQNTVTPSTPINTKRID